MSRLRHHRKPPPKPRIARVTIEPGDQRPGFVEERPSAPIWPPWASWRQVPGSGPGRRCAHRGLGREELGQRQVTRENSHYRLGRRGAGVGGRVGALGPRRKVLAGRPPRRIGRRGLGGGGAGRLRRAGPRHQRRPPTTPGPDAGGGVLGRLPVGEVKKTGPPKEGGSGVPSVVRGVLGGDPFFPEVVVVGHSVDVVVSGSGSSITVVVVVGSSVVVVGRLVVVVVGGRVVVVVSGGRVVVVVEGGGGSVVVVGASVVVVVSGGSVVVVVSGGRVVVVVSGGSVVVVSSGGAVGAVVSGGGHSTGWAGSAGGGHSSAPATSVAKGPVGPVPEPAAPRRTAPVRRATVIRRWAEDVDTRLTSSRACALSCPDSRREWSLVRLCPGWTDSDPAGADPDEGPGAEETHRHQERDEGHGTSVELAIRRARRGGRRLLILTGTAGRGLRGRRRRSRRGRSGEPDLRPGRAAP